MRQKDERQVLKFSVFQDERFIDLNLYQFGWEKCKPLHSFGPYIRNHYLFHFVISGKGVLHAEDKQHTIGAGQGFMICPGQVTTYTSDQDEPWEYVWLEFDGLRVPNCLRQAGFLTTEPVYRPQSRELTAKLCDLMMNIVDQGKSASPMNLIGQGFLFLDLLVRASGNAEGATGKRLRDFYIKEAMSFIEQRYHEDISVEDIADFCGLNRSYFGRIFRDTMGATPQRFLMTYRMAKAEQLLRETKQPIGQISAEVGYANPLHFSRAFKEIYGISPREYRSMRFTGGGQTGR